MQTKLQHDALRMRWWEEYSNTCCTVEITLQDLESAVRELKDTIRAYEEFKKDGESFKKLPNTSLASQRMMNVKGLAQAIINSIEYFYKTARAR